MAVGDMMLGDCPTTFGFGVGSMIEKHGPDFPFELCRDKLSEADLRIGNLEAVLSLFDRSHTPFERMRLRGQPKAAEGLASTGFDIMTLANNHIMQHGREATIETVACLREKNIQVSGLQIDEINLSNEVVFEKNGLKLGFLSYNDRPEQYHLDARLDAPFDLDSVKREIERLKTQVDCLIVSLHWGDEYMIYPSADQVRVAHQLVDQGVDLILGHHPHVLQGIETYHRTPIVYSLGNFVFDMPGEEFQRSMIFDCTLSSSGVTGYSVIPVHINDFYQPRCLAHTEDNVTAELERRSKMISDNQDQQAYAEELQRLNALYRKKELRQYLTNALKYRPTHLISNFWGAIKRRL